MIKIEQYRDKWLAEKFDEFIGFYPREFFVFDNLLRSKFHSKGFCTALRNTLTRLRNLLKRHQKFISKFVTRILHTRHKKLHLQIEINKTQNLMNTKLI